MKELIALSHEHKLLEKRINRLTKCRSHARCIQDNYRLKRMSYEVREKMIALANEICGLNNKIDTLHKMMWGVGIRLNKLKLNGKHRNN